MNIRICAKCVCAVVAAICLTACNTTTIEGAWVEPVPGMESMVQGVRLDKGGAAHSINMATLRYERWAKEGNKLILTGKSIGNHQTLPFTDTLTIEQLTADELLLKQHGGGITRYKRQQ